MIGPFSGHSQLGADATAFMAKSVAVSAGSAQGRANALNAAMATLRQMRATLANTHTALLDYFLVFSNDGPGGVDSVSKTMAFPRDILNWNLAWNVVRAAAAPGAPVLAASGQTVREALRILDQILLFWGVVKVAEYNALAVAETDKANAVLAAQRAAARTEAERQQVEADRQAAVAAAAAAAAAAEQAMFIAAAAAAKRTRNMWIGIGAGVVVLTGVGIYLAAR